MTELLHALFQTIGLLAKMFWIMVRGLVPAAISTPVLITLIVVTLASTVTIRRLARR